MKLYYKNKDLYLSTYQNRYNNESSFHFNLSISKNPAFLVCTFELLSLVSTIRKLDKDLYKLSEQLPGIALDQFTHKCLIDEISLTNDIEGIHSSRKEINDIIIDKSITKTSKRLYGLVKKYQLLGEVHKKISSCEDIRNIYDELVYDEVAADDPDNIPDGLFFRKNSVNVTNNHQKVIHRGINPEQRIIEYINESLRILEDDSIDFLIRIAIFHYMFGYIHPFYDGNGRTSRFISSYLLSKELHPLVSYSLSYNIKKNINQYYNAFKHVNDEKNKGDLTPFILIFLEILKNALSNLYDTLTEKIDALNHYNSLLENSISENSMDVLFILLQNTLFGEKGLSVYELNHITSISLSKIRGILKNEAYYLIASREGNTKLYQINLEQLNI